MLHVCPSFGAIALALLAYSDFDAGGEYGFTSSLPLRLWPVILLNFVLLPLLLVLRKRRALLGKVLLGAFVSLAAYFLVATIVIR